MKSPKEAMADAFEGAETFPILGTGKLDLRKMKEVAQKVSTTDGHG